MSMVGYILGLGDRHPSNLMLERSSGRILHIDFGDCFEVAMHREKFPEKIPFRLTRMLVNAMEASRIEGNYRSTCEAVMRVLRQNQESVMTMLEAFVYDPLITWRLFNQNSADVAEERKTNSGSGIQNQNKDEMLSSSYPSYGSSLSSMRSPTPGPTLELNQQAVKVIERVMLKLRGAEFTTPFGETVVLDVPHQVDKLIMQATSRENLCQLYFGWCPFW